MREKSRGRLIAAEDFIEIAKQDITGWHKAFDLRVKDLIDMALDKNSRWKHRLELEELMSQKELKSPEQQGRLPALILEITNLDGEQLEYEVLRIYANQNDYELTVV